MRRWRVMALAMAGSVLLVPVQAGAAVRGSLTQLSRGAGCLAAVPGYLVPRTCTRARIKYVGPMALARDGRHLYTANGYASARTGNVSAFSRDRRSGRLRQLSGRRGCLANATHDPSLRSCDTARVGRAADVAVSPDGRHLYVAGGRTEIEVAVLARDARSGALTQPSGAGGCVGADSAGCTRGRVDGVHALVVSADGKHVYGIEEAAAVTAYRRETATGALTPLDGEDGCLVGEASDDGARPGCRVVPAVAGATGIAISPDGRHLYVTVDRRPAVAVLARDATTGALSLQDDARVRGEDELYGLTVSPDGATVYATGSFISVLRRDRGSGALTQLAGRAGCAGGRGCAPARAMFIPSGFAVSPDGATAYTAGIDGVAVFARGRAGRLGQLRGRPGCVSYTGNQDHFEPSGNDCIVSRTLINPLHVLVSGDGRHVYASGTSIRGGNVASSIAIFSRAR